VLLGMLLRLLEVAGCLCILCAYEALCPADTQRWCHQDTACPQKGSCCWYSCVMLQAAEPVCVLAADMCLTRRMPTFYAAGQDTPRTHMQLHTCTV
jgi:hypothetical protein